MAHQIWIVELGGKGTIQTFTVVNVAPENREQEIPYIVVLVEMDEGPWLMGNLGGIKPEEANMGLMGKKVAMEKAAVYAGDKYQLGRTGQAVFCPGITNRVPYSD